METVLDNNAEEQQPKRKKTKWIVLGIVIAVVVIAAVVAYFVIKNQREREEARLAIVQSDVYPDGVTVDETDIGGMTFEAAAAALEKANEEKCRNISYQLKLNDKNYSITAADLDLAYDSQSALEQCGTLAREGTLEELQAELADIAANKREFVSGLTYNDGKLHETVSKIASELNTAPVDATFALSENPAEADGSRVVYTPEVNGVTVNETALCDTITEMLLQGQGGEVDIPAEIVPAAVTLDQLQSTVTLRSSSFTSFNHSPYNRSTRVANIKKAAGIINGTVLQPGEIFSMNSTLGNRTYAAGWQPAPAIVQGRSEDQAGGGVCQVSTTLYHAVLTGDLEVVYRQGHSERLSYAPGGLDATIDSGHIDFKWRNNTNSPIYIFAWVEDSDKTIHFELYGEPLPDEYDEIVLSSEQIASVSPSGSMQYEVDPSKPVGYSQVYVKRKSGSIWRSYATYKKNGVEVKKVTIADTKYRAYAGLTIVGPSAYTYSSSRLDSVPTE